MTKVFFSYFLLVTAVTSTLLTSNTQVQARAPAAPPPTTTTNQWESRLAQVEPFDEFAHLPANAQLGGERYAEQHFEPGLGHVLRLDTIMAPILSEHAPTQFHIHKGAKYTHGIKFRVRSPSRIAGAGGGEASFDAERDFQYDLEALLASGFDVSKRTIVMIPGYLNPGSETEWEHAARELWIELYGDDVNVIVVSWPMSKTVYSQAVADTVFVARQTSILLHYLAQLGGTSLHDETFLGSLHLIGHSLGAHIAGFIGQDLGGRVGRITALDPAGPSFDCYPKNARLDRGDARLVEVLHTNGGKMHYLGACAGAVVGTLGRLFHFHQKESFQNSNSWFGIAAQVGHLDYYANNGRTQEGCSDPLNVCDHNRATEIYVDLLRYATESRRGSRRLWAFRAPNYESFESGEQLAQFCPHLLRVGGSRGETPKTENLGECAVPLMDFSKSTSELITELREQFNVNFDANARSEEQPGFYFKTTSGDEISRGHFVGDHFLFKVHLDNSTTWWDSSRCSLRAQLHKATGEVVSLTLSKPVDGSSMLVAPFSSFGASQASARLEELRSSASGPPSAYLSSGKAASLLDEMFARASIVLEIVSSRDNLAAEGCQLALKELEVQSLMGGHETMRPLNVTIMSGEFSTIPSKLEFMNASDFAEHLSSAPSLYMNHEDRPRLATTLQLVVVA